MKNRIFEKTNEHITIDDGTPDGHWVKFEWDGKSLVIDKFGELPLSHRTVRELTAWIADTQVRHQNTAPARKIRKEKPNA